MHHDLISATIKRIRKGLPPLVEGDGRQVRDFTYVGDLVTIMAKAASELGANGMALNVGRGKGISIIEAVALMSDVFGTGEKLLPIHGGTSGGGRGNMSDIRLLKKTIGMHPTTDLREGLLGMKKEMDSMRWN